MDNWFWLQVEVRMTSLNHDLHWIAMSLFQLKPARWIAPIKCNGYQIQTETCLVMLSVDEMKTLNAKDLFSQKLYKWPFLLLKSIKQPFSFDHIVRLKFMFSSVPTFVLCLFLFVCLFFFLFRGVWMLQILRCTYYSSSCAVLFCGLRN